MVELPPNFTFSQSNLQDFIECPRRFYLRHIRRLLWPSQEISGASENERRLRLGQIFHRLAQQKTLGFPQDKLRQMVKNQPEEIQIWWDNFESWWEQVENTELVGERYAETSLACSLHDARLIAKYDLLVFHPEGAVTIFDWKTIQHPPRPEFISRQVQSRIYPFALKNAAGSLTFGKEIFPEQIRMIYWFTADPLNPQAIQYSNQQYLADEDYLSHLILDIAGRKAEDFLLTNEVKFCAHCIYHTFCDRRTSVDSEEWVGDDADDPSLQFPEDWEQISEIIY